VAAASDARLDPHMPTDDMSNAGGVITAGVRGGQP